MFATREVRPLWMRSRIRHGDRERGTRGIEVTPIAPANGWHPIDARRRVLTDVRPWADVDRCPDHHAGPGSGDHQLAIDDRSHLELLGLAALAAQVDRPDHDEKVGMVRTSVCEPVVEPPGCTPPCARRRTYARRSLADRRGDTRRGRRNRCLWGIAGSMGAAGEHQRLPRGRRPRPVTWQRTSRKPRTVSRSRGATWLGLLMRLPSILPRCGCRPHQRRLATSLTSRRSRCLMGVKRSFWGERARVTQLIVGSRGRQPVGGSEHVTENRPS